MGSQSGLAKSRLRNLVVGEAEKFKVGDMDFDNSTGSLGLPQKT